MALIGGLFRPAINLATLEISSKGRKRKVDKHKDATSVDASVRSMLVFFSLNFAQAPALLSTTPIALDCQSVPLSFTLSLHLSLSVSGLILMIRKRRWRPSCDEDESTMNFAVETPEERKLNDLIHYTPRVRVLLAEEMFAHRF